MTASVVGSSMARILDASEWLFTQSPASSVSSISRYFRYILGGTLASPLKALHSWSYIFSHLAAVMVLPENDPQKAKVGSLMSDMFEMCQSTVGDVVDDSEGE